MTDQTWCIAGGDDGADRQLADALLRSGNTVAIVGRNVAPFALLVDDYADAIMPVELTATTSEALAEVRQSIELNLGEVTHFGVLLGELGEGAVDEVAARLLGKLAGAGKRRDGLGPAEYSQRSWPSGAQLILVRTPAGVASVDARAVENADLEARIRLAAAEAELPMTEVRVRDLSELVSSPSVVVVG